MFRWTVKHRRYLLLGLLVVLVLVGLFARPYLAAIPHDRARRMIAARRLDDATWWLDWAERMSPDSGETQFLRARVARRRGDPAAVREHLARAAELGYSRETLQREQWLTLAQSGQLDKAEPQLWDLLMDARGDGREICEAYVIGFAIANRTQDARKLIQTWAEAFPDDPQPYIYLGAVEEDEAAWEAAVQHYRKALERRPDHPEALLSIAKCLTEMKDHRQALTYFQRAAAAGDTSAAPIVGQARSLRELGEVDSARQVLQRNPEVAKSDPAGILLAAQLDVDAGRFEEAVAKLAPLVDQDPRNLEARYVYGVALRGTGQLEEAAEHLNHVAEAKRLLLDADELKRGSLELHDKYRIGYAQIHFGDPAEGVFWLQQVLREAPGHKDAHAALAKYYDDHRTQNPEFGRLADRHRMLSQQ